VCSPKTVGNFPWDFFKHRLCEKITDITDSKGIKNIYSKITSPVWAVGLSVPCCEQELNEISRDVCESAGGA